MEGKGREGMGGRFHTLHQTTLTGRYNTFFHTDSAYMPCIRGEYQAFVVLGDLSPIKLFPSLLMQG